MANLEKLNDLAARTLCPHNILEGGSQIKAILSKLRRTANLLEWAAWLAGTIGLALIVHGTFGHTKSAIDSAWQQTLGVILLCLGYYRTRIIQKPETILTKGRPYAIDIPEELLQLLNDLASGKLHAHLSVKSGIADTQALWTSDGQILDSRIGREAFRNRFAPLLLSGDPKDYDYVHLRLPLNKIADGPIYVRSDEASNEETYPDWWEVDAESENLNSTMSDLWLVGGTLEQFERGLDNFLDSGKETKDPLKRPWIRMILKIGRHQLQKGRTEVSPAAAIKRIRIELVTKYNHLAIPGEKADAFETVRKLIQGSYGGRKIKRFFLEQYGEIPPGAEE